MTKCIVTTTINPVTEAINLFDKMPGWHLIVITDKKTPKDYRLQNGTVVTPEMQESYSKELSDVIGWNCIQRRNFGLLWAAKMGAEVVAVVDDDNIPYPWWGQTHSIGQETPVQFYKTSLPAFDPVGVVSAGKLWHRGYPLQLLSKRNYKNVEKKTIVPDIEAGFWNGDPDIDAICRMEHAPECDFDPNLFPLAGDKIAPFNSQNTFLSRRVLKDYFLFPHVGRMDDIWAAFYVQALGFKVLFSKPSVYQKRNEHDLVKDMKQEYLGYENNLKIVEGIANDPKFIFQFLPPKALEAFSIFQELIAKELAANG